MTESKIEKRVLYIVIFILISILFTLILLMLNELGVIIGTPSILEVTKFLIPLLGMIATVGAATAALVSANVAKKSLEKQNENSKREIMPFIVIEEKDFNIEFDGNNIKQFDLNWETSVHELNDAHTSIGSFLEIVNISNGNAKNIKVKTIIENGLMFLEQLRENIEEEISIYVNNHPFQKDINALHLQSTSDPQNYFFKTCYKLEGFHEEKFLFIQSDGGRNRIRIPDAFPVMFNLFANNLFQYQFDQFPSLKYIITFEDIVGREYEIKYRVKMKDTNIHDSIDENKKATIILSVDQL